MNCEMITNHDLSMTESPPPPPQQQQQQQQSLQYHPQTSYRRRRRQQQTMRRSHNGLMTTTNSYRHRILEVKILSAMSLLLIGTATMCSYVYTFPVQWLTSIPRQRHLQFVPIPMFQRRCFNLQESSYDISVTQHKRNLVFRSNQRRRSKLFTLNNKLHDDENDKDIDDDNYNYNDSNKFNIGNNPYGNANDSERSLLLEQIPNKLHHPSIVEEVEEILHNGKYLTVETTGSKKSSNTNTNTNTKSNQYLSKTTTTTTKTLTQKNEIHVNGSAPSKKKVETILQHSMGNPTKDDNNVLNGNDDNNWNAWKKENERLKRHVRDLEDENFLLRHEVANRLVLESFEGENKLYGAALTINPINISASSTTGIRTSSRMKINTNTNTSNTDTNTDPPMMWCDELEDGQCPVEPVLSFGEALRDRAYWLVGLLTLQSCSGIILARNEALLANHPFIIYFLTMLVGAGGNAGNQASVRVIRGLALGTLNEQTQNQFMIREFKMACSLSCILSLAGFIRAIAFRTPFPETIAISASLFLIVFSSVCLGAVLPLILKKLRIDPAHSSTTIQVVMDILGVVLAVAVSSLLLDSPFGKLMITKMGG